MKFLSDLLLSTYVETFQGAYTTIWLNFSIFTRKLLLLTTNSCFPKKECSYLVVILYCNEISSDDKTAVFEFVCSDTGLGMSEDFQKHAFESYAREGKETTNGYSGAGNGWIRSNQTDKDIES